MIRMLGFLVGLAAVAAPVAAWLLATGRVALPASAPPATAPLAASGAPPPSEPAPTDIPANPADSAPADAPLAPPADPVAVEAAPPGTGTGDPVETQVWRPFRSERAARGFAGHIAGRYGADARVERAGPGDYRVMVGAGSPEALEASLARLRGEAGLAPLEPRP